MTRWTISLLALAITIHLSAAPKRSRGWKSIREQTTCEAVAPGSCIGEYGFTIDATGHFTAGPSPTGLHVEGQLPNVELRKLQQAIANVGVKSTKETCIASRLVPGSSERMTLTSSDGRERVVYRRENPTQTCFGGNREAATRLHDVMQALMAEHYPQHFPQ
jgi:hypothetical protein